MATTFDPFAEFDRLTAGLLGARSGPRVMPVDLYRDADQYVLNADLPESIRGRSISTSTDGCPRSRAQRTAGSAQGVKWLAQERPAGSFLRQFSIGEGVDSSAISATYDNGVLSVIIPVSEKAKPRRIEVKAAPADAQKTLTS